MRVYSHLALPSLEDKLEVLNYAMRDKKHRISDVLLLSLDLTPDEFLQYGTQHGYFYIVRYAIEHNATPDLKLKYVASKGYWDIFNYFVELGSDDW